MGVDGGGDAADSIPPLQAETGSEDGGKRDGDLDWISTGDPDEESCLDHTVSSDEDSDENDSNSINASKRRHLGKAGRLFPLWYDGIGRIADPKKRSRRRNYPLPA